MTDEPTPSTETPPALLVAAFEGWNDAGGSATQSVAMMAEAWDARSVHELDPQDFHDFQVTRPILASDEGLRVLSWPTTNISVATAPVSGRPVLFVQGIEPSFRWLDFCTEILDVAEEWRVDTVVAIGALLADVPHTRPIPCTITSEDPVVQEQFGAARSDYEGPAGIVSVLAHLAQERDLSTMSMWAAIPHYVSQPPSPKATLALLTSLEEVVGEPLPLGDLVEEARAWQEGVDELAEQDPDIAEYVHRLEEAKDAVELPEASGEAIAREFEQYLKRRDSGEKGFGGPPPPPRG